MKVHLAGYNVDTSVLKELQDMVGKRDDLTPEVISAAYARISRDPRPIEEIRHDARREVEKSRRSNSTIIFKMGHHSVAEHAVFNLDIVGVSRYCMEEVEKFRLCSYTEKSQRYITLDKDYVIPEEIQGSALAGEFVYMVERQNKAYQELYADLKSYVFKKHADLAADPKNHNLLEGWAKEDARYVTALATQSQVGMTVNARNLELLLRRFASSGLAEARRLGRLIYKTVAPVAPSIVIFHEANDRDQLTYPGLRELAAKLIRKRSGKVSKAVKIMDYAQSGDHLVAAGLLHTSSGLDFAACLKMVKKMNLAKRKEIFKTALTHMQFYDSLPREFEYAGLLFEIALSAACFGQLKRHRMSSLTVQDYDPRLGLTIPPAIAAIGRRKDVVRIAKQSEEIYRKLYKEASMAAPYVLTNAHRRRVLMRVSARELYHISRLREDQHAQWDIRNVARAMREQAQKVMPLTMMLACGKDRYNAVYKKIYGRLPKVVAAALPGIRKTIV